jgi:hypothetical protein
MYSDSPYVNPYQSGPRVGPMRLGDAWEAPDFDPSTVVSEADSPQTIPQDDLLTQFANAIQQPGQVLYSPSTYRVAIASSPTVTSTTWLWLLAGGLLLLGVVARK